MKPLVCLLILLFAHYHGSSDVGTDHVSALVKEGDSVILNTNVQTNQQEEISWYFNNTRIAKITGDLGYICTDIQCNEGPDTFRDRLKLDHQTGSLTITDTRPTDSGEYKVVVIGGGGDGRSNTHRFRVAVQGVPAAQKDEKNTKSVVEGQSFVLDPEVTKNPNNVMTWYFNDTLIVKMTGGQSQICTDDECKDRFTDRLELNNQTGSLTVTNARITDSGLYQVHISSSSSVRRRRRSIGVTALKSFSISVTAVPDSASSIAAAVGGVCGVLLFVGFAVAFAKRKGICRQQNNQHTVNETSPSLAEAAEESSL